MSQKASWGQTLKRNVALFWQRHLPLQGERKLDSEEDIMRVLEKKIFHTFLAFLSILDKSFSL